MPDKPQTAAGYRPRDVELVRATALHFATRFGDLLEDLTIVGGFVPLLLVPDPGAAAEEHVGTRDLDLGLQLALLDEDGYATLTERLRNAGFRNAVNERGNPQHHAWRSEDGSAIIEFLMPPRNPRDRAGRTRHLDHELAAIVVPGLELVQHDRLPVSLTGATLDGASATRQVWVCGPGAYVVLKALAGRGRGEPKDFYDLWYVVRHYQTAEPQPLATATADRLGGLLALHEPLVDKALDYLAEDFADLDAVGPRRTAAFLGRGDDEDFRADVLGVVQALLTGCRRAGG